MKVKMINWYKKSQVSYRFSKFIREMEIDIDWDAFEENVEDLHELEFKAFKIQTTNAPIHQKRQENILKLIHEKAWDYFEHIRERIEWAFNKWENEHRTESAEEWSEMVFGTQELYGDQAIEMIMQEGIHWGQIHLDPRNIVRHVDPSIIRQNIEEDLYNNPEVYEYQIEGWLNEERPDWEDSGDTAVEYYQNNDLHDEFEEHFFANTDLSTYAEDHDMTYYVDSGTVKRAIAQELYPQYMNMWGGAVENIKEDIDKAVKRMKSITEDAPISEMVASISLALNVMHVGGNIAQDKLDYGSTFLDHLSNMDTEEWVEEVAQEFGV